MKEIISDKTKSKELPEDVTVKREAELQRFLRTLKTEEKCLNDVDYKFIYHLALFLLKSMALPKCNTIY